MNQPKPTLLKAVQSQCHECMGHYQDGKLDCEHTKCSLYRWMPYRRLEIDEDWNLYHPKRRGKIEYSSIDTSGRTGEHLVKWREEQEIDVE